MTRLTFGDFLKKETLQINYLAFLFLDVIAYGDGCTYLRNLVGFCNFVQLLLGINIDTSSVQYAMKNITSVLGRWKYYSILFSCNNGKKAAVSLFSE